ncbi:MAG: type II secretion system protein [Patescibacteria group bacterium]|nr:type II secretion system protein [Patescibacteria group bacterium]
MKKGFTLIEMLVVIAIIGILASIGLGTFTSAQRKARDARRKNDLTTVAKALEVYFNDHSLYPADDDDSHQIKGCNTDVDPTEITCDWGSAFQHANTTPATVYLIILPSDSTASQTYYYEASADQQSFQLYARLENTADPAVPKDGNDPQNYDIKCGTENYCNYGISSPNTTPAAGRTLADD